MVRKSVVQALVHMIRVRDAVNSCIIGYAQLWATFIEGLYLHHRACKVIVRANFCQDASNVAAV